MKKWEQMNRDIFKLKSDYTVYLPKSFQSDRYIVNKDIVFFGNCLTIKEGFGWDGCSPKIKIGTHFIGTPDGRIVNGKPITWEASLVHDALYRNMGAVTLNRKQIDKLFYLLLKRKKFKYALIYYTVVRLFGGIYHKLKG